MLEQWSRTDRQVILRGKESRRKLVLWVWEIGCERERDKSSKKEIG